MSESITNLAEAVAAEGALPVPVGTELEQLRRERDAFRDQRNHVFKTNERLIDQVRESEHARLLAENETRRVQREAAALKARVDEVERAYVFDTAELKRRIAELEAERPSRADVLREAAPHLDALCQQYGVFGAGSRLRKMADEPPVFVPRTERSYWVSIADALNAAHAAGMPVGIDLDGTLTDHHMWSVVWDRAAERWKVAGYDDDTADDRPVPAADGITARVAPTQALREDGEHYSSVHHNYRTGRDLPEAGGR